MTQGLEQAVEPPKEGQHIVRVAGSRGGNIVEVGLAGRGGKRLL